MVDERCVAILEHDRTLARRLATALEARGCRPLVARGEAQRAALLSAQRPQAIYLSEAQPRGNGGELLAELEREARLATLPTLLRVSRLDSLFAITMRRGGLQTVVAPIDVAAVATMLARMARGEEGELRRLVQQARLLRLRTRANLAGTSRTLATTRRLHEHLLTQIGRYLT